MTLDAGIARPAIMDPANVDALAENLGGLAVAPRRVAPDPSKRLLDQLRRRNIAVPRPAGRTRDWWYDTLANNEMTAFLPLKPSLNVRSDQWPPYSKKTTKKTAKWQILTAANARADYEFSLIFLQGIPIALIELICEFAGSRDRASFRGHVFERSCISHVGKLVRLNRYFRDTCYSDLKSLHIWIPIGLIRNRLICDLGVFKFFRGLTSLRVNPLDSLTSEITDLSALRLFPSLTSLDLETRDFNSWGLTDLSALLQIPGLMRVRLNGDMRQMDISALGSYEGLISLDLSRADRITGTAALRSCSLLCSLTLGAWPDTHLDALEACAASLKSLDLGGGDLYKGFDDVMNLADLGVLRSCAALTSLRLQHCAALTDLSPLRSCTALTLLVLNHATTLLDLSALRSCTALTLLDLNYAVKLTDLRGLENHAALTSVCLEGCKSLADLSSLRSCAALTSLNLTYSGHVNVDLNSLQHCVSLTDLDCRRCNMISVSALESCTALKRLDLSGCSNLKSVLVLASLPSLTWLNLGRFYKDGDQLWKVFRGRLTKSQ